MKKIIIAIDGPAGSGKTSTARLVAKALGYKYIDTGAMYRTVGLAVLRRFHEYSKENAVAVLDGIEMDFAEIGGSMHIFLNGEDVNSEIRTPEITNLASIVGTIPEVRKKLVFLQREIGKAGGVVMDGRDIGTVVFPDADLKIFFTASVDARAERRTKEISASGGIAELEKIKTEIEERDFRDSNRTESPLRCAEDAVKLDTTDMSLEEQTQAVIDLARKRISCAG